jgi:hypothetical protein
MAKSPSDCADIFGTSEGRLRIQYGGFHETLEARSTRGRYGNIHGEPSKLAC